MEELKLNLKPLIKRLEIFTKKGYIGILTGSYKSTFKGKGLDFEGYRNYDVGDDASLIDWKATLRAQELLIKVLTEERNVDVIFLVDVSSSMSFASVEKLKNEYTAELIASLSFASIRAGDSVGLIMFTDKIVKSLHPVMGNKQYFMIINSLSDPKLYDGKFDFVKMMKDLMSFAKKRAIVIIVSDFIGLNQGWEKYLRSASKKFEIIGIMVRDPRDYEMPTDVGQVVVSDPYSDKEVLIDTATIKEEYESTVKEQVKYIKEIFINSKSEFLELRTDKPFLHDIIKFFLMRHKRKK